MGWNKRIFGPGPERLTHEFLNDLADQVRSNHLVLKNRAPGVFVGCTPDLSEPGTFSFSPGAVLSAGTFLAFPADAEDGDTARTIQVADVADGSPVWFYIDDEGALQYTEGAPPAGTGWPDHADQPTAMPENSYCVLGWAVYTGDGWEEPRDIRRFIMKKPEDALIHEGRLVVGDVAAGADFQNIQQALNFLEMCYLTERRVTRHILVTQDQTIEEPIQVRIPGVTLEASGGESEDGNKRVTICGVWDTGISTFSSQIAASEAASTALFQLNGQPDVSIFGFSLQHDGSEKYCAFWEPGDRFSLSRISIEEFDWLWIISSIGDRTLHGVNIEDNQVRAKIGLISFPREYDDQTAMLDFTFSSSGCLRDSSIRGNAIQAQYDSTSSDFKIADEDTYYPLIDCGKNDENSSGNRVENNTTRLGIVSLRIGRQSRACNNNFVNTSLYGVWIDSSEPPAMDGRATVLGGTEVSGNSISLHESINNLPWWCSAIRLQMSHCHVIDNKILLNNRMGCGISEGFIQGIDPAQSEPGQLEGSFHITYNERASGWIELSSQGGSGDAFTFGPSDFFNPSPGNVKFRPNRSYYVPAVSPGETQTLPIFVIADDPGPAGYLRSGGDVLSDTRGIYDTFRYTPDGGHTIRNNKIIARNEDVVDPDLSSAPPVTGSFGILLLSANNRISGNTITSTSTGIFVLANSSVMENRVHNSWLGISAYQKCKLFGNEVWWYRAYSPGYRDEDNNPANPLFCNAPIMSGILVSKENTLESNKVLGLPPAESVAKSESGPLFARTLDYEVLDATEDLSSSSSTDKWLGGGFDKSMTRDGGLSSSSSQAFELLPSIDEDDNDELLVSRLKGFLGGILEDVNYAEIMDVARFMVAPRSGSSSSSEGEPSSSWEEDLYSSSSSGGEGIPWWAAPSETQTAELDPEAAARFAEAAEKFDAQSIEARVQKLVEIASWGEFIEIPALFGDDAGERSEGTEGIMDPFQTFGAAMSMWNDGAQNSTMSSFPMRNKLRIGNLLHYLWPAVQINNIPLMMYLGGWFGRLFQEERVAYLAAAPDQDIEEAKDLPAFESQYEQEFPWWLFLNWGGNTLENNIIDLYRDGANMGQWADFKLQVHNGIVSTAGLTGPTPGGLLDLLNLSFSFNTISSTTIRGGMMGYVGTSADLIRDCLIENTCVVGMLPLGVLGPTIEGCHVSGDGLSFSLGRMQVQQNEGQEPESEPFALEFFNALLIPPWNLDAGVYDSTFIGKLPWAVTQFGIGTKISDCRIRNEQPFFGGPGIFWGGHFGSCIGCDFECYGVLPIESLLPLEGAAQSEMLASLSANNLFNFMVQLLEGMTVPIFWPAIWFNGIVFDVPFFPNVNIYMPWTSGNLVTGAQMSACFPRIGWDVHDQSGSMFMSPLWNHGKNPLVGEIDTIQWPQGLPRWTNRVDWRSSWFWTLLEWLDWPALIALVVVYLVALNRKK